MEIPWVIEEQTKVKHELLKKYIDPWMVILFAQQEKVGYPQELLYFDGFSGPGIYFEDDTKKSCCDGSPLIVADVANKHIEHNRERKITIICVDKEKECIAILERELAGRNKYGQDWETHCAEFDDKVNSFLDYIEKRRLVPPPMFFFVDPFGYSGCPMSTLKRILSYPRVELFINLMVYEIVRFLEEGHAHSHLQALFGCDNFEKASTCSSSEEKQLYLLNLYCKQLKEDAGAQYVMPFRINTPGQGTRPKYYLIHTSNNMKAFRLMKDVMAKVSHAQYSFVAIGISPQQSLFEDPDKMDLKERLRNYCIDNASRQIDYAEIEEWAYSNTNGVSKTIKEALLDMERKGIVQVKRQLGQRKTTVTEGAVILYRR